MKRKPNFMTDKGILSVIALLLVIIVGMSSCKPNKSENPKPFPPAIKSGSYKIIMDQGSDNGDANYYTRTETACELSALYTFTATTVTITSNCTTAVTYGWTYNSTTGILTLNNGGGTILIENLTNSGLIWNAILTGQANSRLTLQLVTGS